MIAFENDLATELTAEDAGSGAGPVSLAEQLTGETPPVVAYQTLTGAEDTALATPASPPVLAPIVNTPVGPAGGVIAKVWDKALSTVGQTSNSLNASGQKAAKSLGVSDEAAAKIGDVVPWLLLAVVLAVAGTVYALRRRIFSHHVTA